MYWRGVGKNQDWADMSKDALNFAMHVFDMAIFFFKVSLFKSFGRLCESFH